MKYISTIIKNIKNLSPYFLLIAIYFFFVNLDVRKDKINKLNTDIDGILSDVSSSLDKKSSRITIPVIPYKE